MNEIIQLPVGRLSDNPHRNRDTFPPIEEKVEALMRSMQLTGVWPSIIARPTPSGFFYEMAFGLHRLEAAKRLHIEEIPVIVKELSDVEMLQYMGTENAEEYSSQFIVLFNTWDSAVKYYQSRAYQQTLRNNTNSLATASGLEQDANVPLEVLEIAKLIGWITPRSDRDAPNPTRAALTCSKIYNRIRIELNGNLSDFASCTSVNSAESKLRECEAADERVREEERRREIIAAAIPARWAIAVRNQAQVVNTLLQRAPFPDIQRTITGMNEITTLDQRNAIQDLFMSLQTLQRQLKTKSDKINRYLQNNPPPTERTTP